MKSSLGSVMSNVDKYGIICSQLKKLGYKNELSPDSLPLIEELVNDILVYKEQLNHYQQMIKDLEKEKRNLEKAVEPYRQDNARLVIENNDIHEKLYKQKEEHDIELKELKKQNRAIQSEKTDLEFIISHSDEKIKELQKELLEKNKKISSLVTNKTVVINSDGKTKVIPATFPVLEIREPLDLDQEKPEDRLWEATAQAKDINVRNIVEVMEKRAADLLEELEELKLDNQHQSDIICALKCQVTQKDREIDRLRHALEGGRPLTAVSRDCCCQCKQKDCKIRTLEEQLETAVEKQHEAMSRALQLAERNQHLERELKDIDSMALAVEEECQNKVKFNLRNMDVLQDKLRQKIDEIKKLEETVMDMKSRIEHDELELESLRKEKKLLEKNLNLCTSEKKSLNDKMNHFLLIEKNLNSEISRLQEINKSLHRQIGDMEERVMDVLGTSCKTNQSGKQKKHNPTLGLPSTKTYSNSRLNGPKVRYKDRKMFCPDDPSSEDCYHLTASISLLDKVQQERDFYHNECHRLKEQLGSTPSRSDTSINLMMQLKDQDRRIEDLKEENFMLKRENATLTKRLESGEHVSCSSGDSIKIILDRLEKERDKALSDISRLQGERDALKERIKFATESQMGEHSRLERIVMDNEERIRRLESERRELIGSQSSQRLILSNLEEKCDEYKDQARNAQTELAQMTANYNQLKTLQEQTDRSLSEVQGRLSQTDIELRSVTIKMKELEKINSNLENEISVLKKEKCSLKSNLTFIEKEKDGLLITLDEKTEKVAKLEAQIKKQDSYIGELNEKICHLETKFEFTLNEKTSREHGLRTLERTVDHLKEELQQSQRQKEAFIRENRRLQDDLASAAKDCLSARRELDNDKQEVENLKRQLQQYVNEVKRAEELLSKKEAERNQMLDHFRSLSLEATALETNNHTLESTVENTRTQLTSAKNRIVDLEHQIASKDSLLYSYEKQIAELTTQIAELETKLKQQTELKNRAEEDLSALRDLCSTIDGQKEALRRQANNFDAEKIHLLNEVRRLSEEYEGLNEKLTHERSLSQTLEKSLSNSRQETLEHKITNKDLQTHIQHLRQKVDELTEKLDSESQDVRRYQSQCAELSQQVSELRREVTNARFEQAKSMEDSRRHCLGFHEDDVKEIRFDANCQNISSRNIPPLTFPEDSDRTVSLDSGEDYLNFHFEDPGNSFGKSYRILSPLIEKFEGKSGCGSTSFNQADTSSELSSLPEDSEPKKRTILTSSDDKMDLTPYPTYSIHTRGLDSDTRTYKVSAKFEEKFESSNIEDPISFCGTKENPPGSETNEIHRNFLAECFPSKSNFEDSEPCSECEFQKSIWRMSPEVVEKTYKETSFEISLPEILSPTSSPRIETQRKSNSEETNICRNSGEDYCEGTFKSEIDENTFSLHGKVL